MTPKFRPNYREQSTTANKIREIPPIFKRRLTFLGKRIIMKYSASSDANQKSVEIMGKF